MLEWEAEPGNRETKTPAIVKKEKQRKRTSGETEKGSLASVAWPAKNLILSSCPQRSERPLHILDHTLASLFPLCHRTSPTVWYPTQAPPTFCSSSPAAAGLPPSPQLLWRISLSALTEGSPGRPGGDSPTVEAVLLPFLSAPGSLVRGDSLRESLRPSVLGIQAVLSGVRGRWCDLRLPAPSERPAFPSELDNRKNR